MVLFFETIESMEPGKVVTLTQISTVYNSNVLDATLCLLTVVATGDAAQWDVPRPLRLALHLHLLHAFGYITAASEDTHPAAFVLSLEGARRDRFALHQLLAGEPGAALWVCVSSHQPRFRCRRNRALETFQKTKKQTGGLVSVDDGTVRMTKGKSASRSQTEPQPFHPVHFAV